MSPKYWLMTYFSSSLKKRPARHPTFVNANNSTYHGHKIPTISLLSFLSTCQLPDTVSHDAYLHSCWHGHWELHSRLVFIISLGSISYVACRHLASSPPSLLTKEFLMGQSLVQACLYMYTKSLGSVIRLYACPYHCDSVNAQIPRLTEDIGLSFWHLALILAKKALSSIHQLWTYHHQYSRRPSGKHCYESKIINIKLDFLYWLWKMHKIMLQNLAIPDVFSCWALFMCCIPLHSIQTAAACKAYYLPKFSHVTFLMRTHHRLCVAAKI